MAKKTLYGVSLKWGTIKTFELETEDAHRVFFLDEDGKSCSRNKISEDYFFTTSEEAAYAELVRRLEETAREHEAEAVIAKRRRTAAQERLDELVALREEQERLEAERKAQEDRESGSDDSSYGLPSSDSTLRADEA